MEDYQPMGDNIFCKCKTEIDVTRNKPVQVVEPAPQEATVSGLR